MLLMLAFVYILKFYGFPNFYVRAIQQLYLDNSRHLFAGRTRVGFIIAAGLKQGCPRSGAIFAVILNPLMRVLGEALGPAFPERFFDDIRAVCELSRCNYRSCWGIFGQFGLDLDVCVALPLWQFDDSHRQHLLRDPRALIPEFSISECSVYLGIMVGPTARFFSWRDCVPQFLQAVYAIRRFGLGLRQCVLLLKVIGNCAGL
jgi:hypothetical protein